MVNHNWTLLSTHQVWHQRYIPWYSRVENFYFFLHNAFVIKILKRFMLAWVELLVREQPVQSSNWGKNKQYGTRHKMPKSSNKNSMFRKIFYIISYQFHHNLKTSHIKTLRGLYHLFNLFVKSCQGITHRFGTSILSHKISLLARGNTGNSIKWLYD